MPNSMNLTRYYALQSKLSALFFGVTCPVRARYWDAHKQKLRKLAVAAGWPV